MRLEDDDAWTDDGEGGQTFDVLPVPLSLAIASRSTSARLEIILDPILKS